MWILGLTLIDINFFYYREQIISLYLFLSLSDSNYRSKINLTWLMDTCFRVLSQKERNRIMKSIIAVIFLCTFSVTAAATMQERDNGPLDHGASDNTYFGQLEEAFNNAAPAQESDVLGWTAGRCFYKDQPNFAKNGALAGFTASGHPAGPGLESDHMYVTMNSPLKAESYYDDFAPSGHDNLMAIVAASRSAQRDGSLVESHPRFANTHAIRKGVIIGPKSDTEYLLSRGNNKHVIGVAYSYCYYFKKLDFKD